MAIKGGKPYLAYTPLSHYIFCPVVKVVSTQFPPCVPAEIALISTLTRQVCTYQRLTYLLTLSTYRCADLTAESEDSEGNTTHYEYDDNGNLISVTDEEGKTTTYTYDDHGNMLTMTAPDGLSYAYTYDAFGNQLTSKVIDSSNTSSYVQTSSYYSANGAVLVS